MQVDGPKIPFDVSLAGRRSPQLIARLTELSEALTNAGVKSSPYDHIFEGRDSVVPVDNSVLPELEPYRSLDFERLRVVGEGHFDPIPYLEDNLCMAYCNPDCLLHSGLPDQSNLPCIRDPLDQIVGLMKVWDSRGLLLLHEHLVLKHASSCLKIPFHAIWISTFESADGPRELVGMQSFADTSDCPCEWCLCFVGDALQCLDKTPSPFSVLA